MIIMISGKMGAGKTALAKFLETFYSTKGFATYRKRFAAPLYEMQDAVRGVLKSYGVPQEDYDYTKKDGWLLQQLGTQWGRDRIHKDVWSRCIRNWVNDLKTERLDRQLDANYVVLIEDLRFENEFDPFPEAYKIRLECDRELRKERCENWRENDTHESEIGLDEYAALGKFDLLVDTGLRGIDETRKLVIDYLTDPLVVRKKHGLEVLESIGAGSESASNSGGSQEGVEEAVP